jgi:hypothetical protein
MQSSRTIVRGFTSVAFTSILLLAAASCGGSSSGDVAGPENTVAVVVNGNGKVTCNESAQLVCPGDCGPMDWSAGVQVHLTATPNTGSSFGSWTGACTGTDPSDCVFVVTGHMVVTATFTTP